MVLLLLGATLSGGIVLSAADAVFPSGTSRQSYVDQASQELRQVRIQVDMTARRAPLAAQARFGVVYDALAEAEQALGELRSANESDVGQRRVQFEQAKAKALRLWRDFKIGVDSSAPNRG